MKPIHPSMFCLMLFVAMGCGSQQGFAGEQDMIKQGKVASDVTRNNQTEKPEMPNNVPRPSRPAPPRVLPIEHNGIRYQQDTESFHYGGTQVGGYLVAVQPTTGERLWMLKVYEVPMQDPAIVSTPGRYFRTMRLVPGKNALEIENEVGGKYLVDLDAKTSTWISGPDSTQP